jgi:radical SAM protein with 4Fe4S-binding SPASM domain
MSIAMFATILDQLRDYSHLLHFHVLGEPLLHPEIGTFLDKCAEFGYRVNIVTNGVLLGECGDALLGKPALRQLSVSLHSLSEQSARFSLDDYIETIRAFAIKTLKQPGFAISLRLWNFNGGEDLDFQSSVIGKICAAFSHPKVRIDTLTPEHPLRLAENVFVNPAPRFEWPDLANKEYGNRGFCHGLRDQIAILVDGTVVPCCLDHAGSINLGSITETPIKDILSGDRAKRMRNGFAAGMVVEELCRKCSYRLRFNRAPAQ